MAGKIFSSRNENTIDTSLQDFVFLLHDLLKKDIEPANITTDLIDQLDESLVETVELCNKLTSACTSMTFDMLGLSVQNTRLMHALSEALRSLEALAAPANGDAFEKALQVLKHEGAPRAAVMLCNESIVELTFEEDTLVEALRAAITEYNQEASQF